MNNGSVSVSLSNSSENTSFSIKGLLSNRKREMYKNQASNLEFVRNLLIFEAKQNSCRENEGVREALKSIVRR